MLTIRARQDRRRSSLRAADCANGDANSPREQPPTARNINKDHWSFLNAAEQSKVNGWQGTRAAPVQFLMKAGVTFLPLDVRGNCGSTNLMV